MSIFAMFSPDGKGQIRDLSGNNSIQKRMETIQEMKSKFEEHIGPQKQTALLNLDSPPMPVEVLQKFKPTVLKAVDNNPFETNTDDVAPLELLKQVTEIARAERYSKKVETTKISQKGPRAFDASIFSLSQKHGVDPKLVKAVVQHESSFNPKAVSRSGAMGLMQLMPKTAQWLGVKNAFDPVQNLDGGIKYLSSLLKKYHGNPMLALAAYNAGPTRVDKAGGIPNIKETQRYVQKIMKTYLQGTV